MPAVDVDVTAIPDMIEAQLTLSYSRLAHLIRLIVDQGNGHEMDLEKLTNRMDALARENAELRTLVDALLKDKPREGDIRTEMDALRREISRLAEACAENSRQVTAAEERASGHFREVDNQLHAQSEHAAEDVGRLRGSVLSLEGSVRGLADAFRGLDDFVALWDSEAPRVATLARVGDDGAIASTAEDRVVYLHGLPAFARVSEELEVMRQMLRQQANDALTAKTVAGALRRTSAAEAAAAVSAANAMERGQLDAVAAAVEDVERRLRAVETRRLPPLEQARHSSQEQRRGSPSDGAELAQLQARLQELEERLRGLTFRAAGGSSVEEAALGDLDVRLQRLEGVVEGRGMVFAAPHPPSAQRERSRQPPGEAAQPGSTKPEESINHGGQSQEVGGKPSQQTLPPVQQLSPQQGQQVRQPHQPQPSQQPKQEQGHPVHRVSTSAPDLVTQPNVAAYRRQSHSTNPPPDPENHVQLLEQTDGLRRRVAQLEENCAILELHKADRRELQQLEQTFRNAAGPTGSWEQPQCGQSNGYYYTPQQQQRPVTHDGRYTYATEPTQSGTGSSILPSSAPIGRPMFIGGSSHFLRDSSGSMTTATIAPSHVR